MEITIIKMVKAITDSRKIWFRFRIHLLSLKLLFCLLSFITLLRIVGVEVLPPSVLGLFAAVLGIHYIANSIGYCYIRNYFVERFRLETHPYDLCTVICCPICAACQMHSELEYQKNKPEFDLYPNAFYSW